MREALKGLHKALKKSLSKALGGISLFRDHRSRNFRRNRRVEGVSGSAMECNEMKWKKTNIL